MKVTRVRIFQAGTEVSDDCCRTNGKANPFGWSVADLEHHGRRIGRMYCGKLDLTPEARADGYTMTVTEEEE